MAKIIAMSWPPSRRGLDRRQPSRIARLARALLLALHRSRTAAARRIIRDHRHLLSGG